MPFDVSCHAHRMHARLSMTDARVASCLILRPQSEKHGENIHNVVDAVKKSPPTPDMRMVLVDGKWRLMTNTVKADFESSVPS